LTIERTTVNVADDSGRIAMLEKRTVRTDDAAETLVRYVYSNHPAVRHISVAHVVQ